VRFTGGQEVSCYLELELKKRKEKNEREEKRREEKKIDGDVVA